MADVITTTVKKVITDAIAKLPSDLNIKFYYGSKGDNVLNNPISVYFGEGVLSGATSVMLLDNSTDAPISSEYNVVGYGFSICNSDFIITGYNHSTGYADLNNPIEFDIEFDRNEVVSLIPSKNTLLMQEQADTHDRAMQRSLNQRIRKKALRFSLSVLDDIDASTTNRFIKWLNLVLNKEQVQAYDENGIAVVGKLVYIAEPLEMRLISKDTNNQVAEGRIRVYIYENLCDELSQL